MSLMIKLVRSATRSRLVLASTLATAAWLTASGSAQAAFRCGPNALTYNVTSNAGARGAGVRCVKIEREVENREYRISWYGEGYWGSFKYRHFGHFGYDMNTSTYHAVAADLYGNGESGAGRTRNLTLAGIGNPLAPTEIVVSGDWRETWTLTDGTDEAYTSVLEPIRVCGPYFTEFRVVPADRSRPGFGVRCMLQHGQPLWEVLGAGYWSNSPYEGRYLHIITSSDMNNSHGWDLCDPSQADFCNNAALRIWTLGVGTPAPYEYVYGWDENWYLNHTAQP